AFDGLQQGTLLAADVAARAFDDLQPKRQARPEKLLAPEHFLRVAHGLPERRDLPRVLVPYVDVPFLGAKETQGQDHRLDDQMGDAEHELAVLEGARLALVAVANDMFLVG